MENIYCVSSLLRLYAHLLGICWSGASPDIECSKECKLVRFKNMAGKYGVVQNG